MLGDACTAAGLASIPVELVLHDGTHVVGTPTAKPADGASSPINETGYSSHLLIDGDVARLEDVIEFVIRSP